MQQRGGCLTARGTLYRGRRWGRTAQGGTLHASSNADDPCLRRGSEANTCNARPWAIRPCHRRRLSPKLQHDGGENITNYSNGNAFATIRTSFSALTALYGS
eukprot:9472891-Pyramimonas_sp.AAC.1